VELSRKAVVVQNFSFVVQDLSKPAHVADYFVVVGIDAVIKEGWGIVRSCSCFGTTW
jgi:hypothetical protein